MSTNTLLQQIIRVVITSIMIVSHIIGISFSAYAQSLPEGALPQGGNVVQGNVTINVPVDNSMTINQASQRAIIDWQGFSVGQGHGVHFNNGSGATLNRVIGTGLSRIDGNLTATGDLFLINQHGVIIGKEGRVETGGSFVASTLDINNDDFMDGGDNLFVGSSTSSVTNLGKVSSLGGDVAFLAHKVVNEGEITAQNGTVGLAVGREILLRDAATDDGKFLVRVGHADSAIEEKGKIAAANVELRANGGNIYALAGNDGGSIKATGVQQKDGRIFLTAEDTAQANEKPKGNGKVEIAKAIKAKKSNAQGGDIFVNADLASVGGLLDVDGASGGNIDIRSEGDISFTGNLYARGTQGNGGNVKVLGNGDILTTENSYFDVSGHVNGGRFKQEVLNSEGETELYGNYRAAGTNGKGGRLELGGGYSITSYDAQFDATGKAGGGLIRLGGKYLGGNTDGNSTAEELGVPIYHQDELLNTQNLGVTKDTVANASTTGAHGDGGRVIFWADNVNNSGGQLKTQPGSQSGEGGFIETSGKEVLNLHDDISINTSAEGGVRSGTWLLDPRQVIIKVGGTAGYGDVNSYSVHASGQQFIKPSTVINQLFSSDAFLSASQSVEVRAGSPISTGATKKLTFRAGQYIDIRDNVSTGGTISLRVNATGAVDTYRPAGASSIYISPTSTVSSFSQTGGIEIFSQDGFNTSSKYAGDIKIDGTLEFYNLFINDYSGPKNQKVLFGTTGVLKGVGSNAKALITSKNINFTNASVVGNVRIFAYADSYTDTSNNKAGSLNFKHYYGVDGTIAADRAKVESQYSSGHVFSFKNRPTLYVKGQDRTVTYNGSNQTLTSVTANVGLVWGDSFADATVTGTTFSTKKDAGSHSITVTNSGTSAIGYIVGGAGLYAGSLTINKKAATVTLGATAKAYDGTTDTVAPTVAISGFVTGQGATSNKSATNVVYSNADVAYSNGAVSNRSLTKTSAFALTPNSGTNLNNYSFTYTGSAKINPKVLALEAAGGAKTYDGTKTATGVTATIKATDIIAGDTVSVKTTNMAYEFANKDVHYTAGVLDGQTVNITGLELEGTDAGNYGFTVSHKAIISKKSLVINASAGNKAYDGGTNANVGLVTAIDASGVETGDTVTLVETARAAAFDDANVADDINVTITGLTLGGADKANYDIGPISHMANITKRDLNVTLAADDREYDGTTAATGTFTISSGLQNSETAVFATTSKIVFADKDVARNAAGNVINKDLTGSNVTLDSGSSTALLSNYSLVYTGQAKISPKVLELVVTDADKTYDATTAVASTFDVNIKAGEVIGSEVVTLNKVSKGATFDSADVKLNATTGLVENQDLTLTGLSLAGADNANYTFSTANSAKISQKELTINVTGGEKVYDGLTTNGSTLTASITGGKAAPNDDVSLDLDAIAGEFADANVAEDIAMTISGIELAGAKKDNYFFTAPTGHTADITKRNLSIALSAADKTYDKTTVTTGAAFGAITGLQNGETANVDSTAEVIFSSANVARDASNDVTGVLLTGSNVTLASGSTANLANYNLVYTGNAKINPKTLVLDLTDAAKTYDATTALNSSFDVAIKDGEIITGDDVALNKTGLGGAFDSADVNLNATTGLVEAKNFTITGLALSGTTAGNYTFDTAYSAIISQKSLGINVTGGDKAYDGNTTANSSLTAELITADKAAPNDDVSLDVSNIAGVFADKNANDAIGITITGLALTGAKKDNYIFTTPTDHTAKISKLQLTANLEALTKTYDGTTDAVSGEVKSFTGFITGEGASATAGYTVAFKNKGVAYSGTNIVAQELVVSGLTLSADVGTDLNNYEFDQTTDVAGGAIITPKTLAIEFAGGAKAYDQTIAIVNGAVTAALPTTDGVINGDVVVLNTDDMIYSYADANVKRDAANNVIKQTINISGHKIQGTDSGNYILGAAVHSAIISPKLLQIKVNVEDKIYDGNAVASITANLDADAVSNVIDGDEATISTADAIAVFDDKNVGLLKDVNVTGISVSGAQRGNYTLEPSYTARGNLNKRVIKLKGIAVNKIYDGTTTATGSVLIDTSTPLVAGETVTINESSAAINFANADAKLDETVNFTGYALQGTDVSNYELSTDPVTDLANIAKKELTVTVDDSDADKTYDGQTLTTAIVTLGGYGGDSVELNTGYTANFLDANAGVDKTFKFTSLSINDTVGDGKNYKLPSIIKGVGTINKREVSINVAGGDKEYNASDFADVTLTVDTAGVVSGETVEVATGSYTAKFADKNAGNDKTVTIAGVAFKGAHNQNYVAKAINYTATISPKVLGADITANTKTYDGNTTVNGYTVDFLKAGDTTPIFAGDVVSFNANTQIRFNSKDAGTAKTLTVSGATLSNSNYTIDLSKVTGKGVINPKTVSVIASVNDRTYDNTDVANATIEVNSSSIVSNDVVNFDSTGISATFDNKNAGENKLVTLAITPGKKSLDGNYVVDTSAPITTNATINKKLVTVTVAGGNKVYDGSEVASVTYEYATADLISGDTVQLNSSGAVANFANKNAGDNKQITVTGLSFTGANGTGDNYEAQVASHSANITKRTLTASITADAREYDGTDINVSNGNITFTNKVADDDITLAQSYTLKYASKNAGTGIGLIANGLVLNGADSGNYEISSENVTGTGTINKKELTVNVDSQNASKVYDGTTNTGAFVTLAGVVNGEDVTLAENYGVAFEDANVQDNKNLVFSGIELNTAKTDSVNYVLSSDPLLAKANITKKALTLTITGGDKTYDGTQAALGVNISIGSGVVSGETVTLNTIAMAANFGDANAGENKAINITGVTLDGTTKDNYSFDLSHAAAISKKQLTAAISADGKTYDGTTNAQGGNVVISGLVNGENVSIDQGYNIAFASKNVKRDVAGVVVNQDLTVSNLNISAEGGTNLDNYIFDQTQNFSGTARLDPKKVTLTATANNKTYDGTTSATGTLAINTGQILAADSDVALNQTAHSAAFANKNANDGVDVTFAGVALADSVNSGNYVIDTTAPITAQANIAKKVLSVTASGGTRDYDGTTDATVTYALDTNGIVSVGGTAENVTLDESLASAKFADKTADTNKAITVTGLKAAGTDAANYEIGTITHAANINKLALTANITATAREYDGTVDNVANGTITFNNKVAGDTVNLTNDYSIKYASKDAGTGIALSATGLILEGADAANYSIVDASATGDADINKKVLIVSVDTANANKTYDGTTDANVSASLTGVVGNEDVTLASGYTVVFDNKNAGQNRKLNFTGVALDTAKTASSNYELSTSPIIAAANIEKRALALTVTDGKTKTYDGSDVATLTYSHDALTGDVVEVIDGSSNFTDGKNAGLSKTISVANRTLSGAAKDNYTVADNEVISGASITKRDLVLTFNADSKVYDGTKTATILSNADNAIETDDITVAYASAEFQNANAEDNKAITVKGITVTGADKGNYNFSSTATAQGTANITTKLLSVTAAADGKIYDATKAATVNLTANAGDVVGNDVVTFTAASYSAEFASANAGDGQTVTVNFVADATDASGNYKINASTPVTTTADIAKKIVDVTVAGGGKTYDGTNAADVTYEIDTDDVVVGQTLSVDETSATATFADKNAGTNKAISVAGLVFSNTGGIGSNYEARIASHAADVLKKTLTATVTATDREYDGTTAVTDGGVVLAGVIANDTTSLKENYSIAYAAKDAGAQNLNLTLNAGHSLTLEGTDADNYSIVAGDISGAGTINKKVLSLTADSSDVNKTYDGTDTANVTLSLDGVVAGENVTQTAYTAKFASANAGAGVAVSFANVGLEDAATNAANANYELSAIRPTVTGDIAKKVLTAAITGGDRTYDGTADVVTSGTGAITVALDESGLIAAGDASLNETTAYGATFDSKNAGARSITVSGLELTGAQASNYELQAVTGSATIAKKDITATLSADNKVYDGGLTTNNGLATLTGLIDNDTVSAASGYTVSFADKNANTGVALEASGITLEGADKGNYNFVATNITGTADIDAKLLSVTAAADGKTYDATKAAAVNLTANAGDVVGNDVVTFTAASYSAEFASANAGDGQTVTVNFVADATDASGNYKINASTPVTTTADIAKKIVDVTVAGGGKTYDGTNAADVTYEIDTDDVVVGQTLSVDETSATATFADKNAGTNKAISVAGLVFSNTGGIGSNYEARIASHAADVLKKTLTATVTATDREYDGTTAVTDGGVVLAGVIANDTTSLKENYSIAYAAKDAGAQNLNLTLNAGHSLTLEGTDADNYSIVAGDISGAGTINKKVLSLTADSSDVNKTYDGTDTANVTLSLDGVVAGENVTQTAYTAKFASANAGAGVAVSFANVGLEDAATNAANANYELSAIRPTVTGDIAKKVLTAAITGGDRTYDGTADVVTSGTGAITVALDESGLIAAGDASLNETTAYGATFDSKNAGARSITVSGLELTGAQASNYELQAVTGSATIAKKDITATLSADNKVYDGGLTTNNGLATLTGLIDNDTVSAASGYTVSFADKNANTGVALEASGITLEGADKGNYNFVATNITGTADIDAKLLSVTAAADGKTYDATKAAAVNLTANADDVVGNDVVTFTAASYSAEFASANAGDGQTVTVNFVADATDASGNYKINASTPVTTTADIAKKIVDVTVAGGGKTYDGTNAADVTYEIDTDDVVVGQTLSVDETSATATFADKNAGTNKAISVAGLVFSNTGGIGSNYEARIASHAADVLKKTLTATVTATDREYDGTTAVTDGGVVLDGVIANDTTSLKENYSIAYAAKDAGAQNLNLTLNAGHSLTLEGTDANNYSIVAGDISGAGTINKKVLSLTADSSDVNKTYDGTDTANVTLSLDGVVAGENVTQTAYTAKFASANAGAGVAVSFANVGLEDAATNAANANYELSAIRPTVTGDIAKKVLTAAITGGDRTYDGTADVVTSGTGAITVALDESGLIAAGDASLNETTAYGATFDSKNAGARSITVSGLELTGAQASNYELQTVTGSATIAKKDITATLSADNKVYDGGLTTNNGLATLTGLIDNDTVSAASGYTVSFADKNANTGVALEASGITLEGADKGNYNFVATNITGTADIDAKLLSVTAAADGKTYDGTKAAAVTLTAKASDIAGNDTVTFDTASYSAEFAEANAGTDVGVTVNFNAGATDASGNYKINSSVAVTTTADIAKKIVDVTVAGGGKTYDGTNAADVTYTLESTDVVSGQILSVDTTNASATFADKNAGANKAISVAGLGFSGADGIGSNYEARIASHAADVLKKTLTATVTATDREYDGTTAVTDGGVVLDGVIANDTTSLKENYSIAYAAKDAGAQNLNLTLNAGHSLTLEGTDADNYSIVAGDISGAGTINKKVLSLTADSSDVNKTYDGTDTANVTLNLNGVVAGENVTQTAYTAKFASANADTGVAVSFANVGLEDAATNAANANYELSAVRPTVTGDIAKKVLTATITGGDRTYDGTTDVVTSGTGAITVALDESGLIAAGDASLNETTAYGATFDSKNAGARSITVSGLELTGAQASNYELQTVTGSATIAKKDITATLSADNKVYDGGFTTNNGLATLTGLIDNDTVSAASGYTVSFADKNANTGVALEASGITLEGADKGNYNFVATNITGTADIDAKLLSVTAAADGKTYDGTKAAAVTLTANAGDVVGNDVVTFTAASYSAEFASANAGDAQTVTVNFNAGATDASGNYKINSSVAVTTTADIAKKIVDVTVAGGGKTYDGTNAADVTYTLESTDVVSGQILSVDKTNASATFADKNAGANKAISVAGLGFSGADGIGSNYEARIASHAADVLKKTLTATVTATDREYDGTTAVTDGGVVLDGVIANDTTSLKENYSIAYAAKDAGAQNLNLTLNAGHSLTLEGTDADNYSIVAGDISGAGTINKKVLSLTADSSDVNKTYDGTDTANVTLNLNGVVAGENVTQTAYTAKFASANADTGVAVSFANVGLEDAATNAANANYELSAVRPTVTGDIAKKVLTATITGGDRTYDGTTDVVTSGTGAITVALDTDGVVTGETITLDQSNLSAAFADANVGTDKDVTLSGLTLAGATNANYALDANHQATITAKQLTATLTADGKTYDGTTAVTNGGVAIEGLVANDNITANAGYTITFANKNVKRDATGAIIDQDLKVSDLTLAAATGTNLSNYTFNVSDDVSGAARVAAKMITLTATAEDKTYDGTTDATTVVAIADGQLLATDQDVMVDQSAYTAAFADKNAGDNINVGFTGVALANSINSGNYVIDTSSTLTAKADIAKKLLSVNVTGGNKTYDGKTDADVAYELVAADVVTDGQGVAENVELDTSLVTAAFADKHAANNKAITITGLKAGGSDGANYEIATLTHNANISKLDLTAKITADARDYDGTDGNLVNADVAFDNRIAGDDIQLADGYSIKYASKNVGTGIALTAVAFGLSGADAGNYNFGNTSATGTADIRHKELSVVVNTDNADKTYDGTNAVNATIALDGAVDGEAVSFASGYTIAFADKNAQADKNLQFTGVELDTANAVNTNYKLSTTPITAKASIEKLAITIAAEADGKTYDGNANAEVTLDTTGKLADDVLEYKFNSATFDSKNAGTGKTVTVAGIYLDGADKDNYSFNASATNIADISAKALTVTSGAAEKTYDGTLTANVQLTTNGVVDGDQVTVNNTGVTFDDKNAGTGKTVTVNGITLAGNDAANYSVVSSVQNTASIINKKLIQVTADAQNKTYDGSLDADVNLASNGVVTNDTVFFDNTAAVFADKNANDNIEVTVSGISLSGQDAANYEVNAVAKDNASITKKMLTVTATSDGKVYDGSASAVVTLTGTGVIGSEEVMYQNASASYADKNVGLDKLVSVSGINLTGADAGNYEVNQTATTQATITQKTIGVAVNALNKTYDATTVAQVNLTSADLVAGDTVNFANVAAEFSNKNVEDDKVVTVTGISATGADASNYSFVTEATGSANIDKKAITVTAKGSERIYDGSTTAVVTLEGVGVEDGDSLTYAYTGANFVDKNVGVEKSINVAGISLAGADSGNYKFNQIAQTTADITKKSVTVKIDAEDKIYDGQTNAVVELSAIGIVANDTVNFNETAANFADKNTSAGKTVTATGILISGADAGNYSFNDTAIDTATISKKEISITASAKNKIYDGTLDAEVTLDGTGIVSGDTVTYNYGSAAFADKDVALAKDVTVENITLGGADSGNYSFDTETTDKANITKKVVTITATAQDKVYNGNTNATVNLASAGVVTGDSITYSNTSALFTDKNAGIGKTINIEGIALSGGDADNYSFNTTTTSTASITAKVITVSAAAADKTYDGSKNAEVALTGSGIVTGDNVSYNAASAVFGDKNVGVDKTVNVTGITLGGADAGNYSINTSATDTATVNAKQLIITANADDKTYDGTKSANVELTGAGIVTGDNIGFNHSSAKFIQKNVGAGITVDVDGITLTGAAASNYSFSTSTATTADINKKAITITADAQGKTYDGSTQANVTLASSDIVTGDSVNYSHTTATFVDKSADTNKLVSVAGISLSGADAANYSYNTTASDTATVDKKAIIINVDAQDRAYDGTTTATVALTSGDIIANDSVNINNTSANFDSANVGTNKAVTVAGISLSGADAENYSYSTTASNTADISKLFLNFVFDGSDKVYDGNTNATVAYVSDNRTTGDEINVGFGSAAFDNKNAGSNKVIAISDISISGADAANYDYATTATINAAITPKALTVTALDDEKIADGVAYSGGNGVEYNGFVAGENVASLSGSLDYTGSSQGATDDGSYDIVPTGLTSQNYDIANNKGTLTITPQIITTISNQDNVNGGSGSNGASVDDIAIANGEGNVSAQSPILDAQMSSMVQVDGKDYVTAEEGAMFVASDGLSYVKVGANQFFAVTPEGVIVKGTNRIHEIDMKDMITMPKGSDINYGELLPDPVAEEQEIMDQEKLCISNDLSGCFKIDDSRLISSLNLNQ